MYLEHYGLTEPPFSITPDPRFVFLSERHRDALAHLLFGIGQGGGGGFVQLTGEVGTGKTTLSRLLLEQLPDHARVALVLNPRQSPVELLETICEELHLDLAGRRGSLKALVDALNAYLLDAYAQGLRVVLIIDEAQNLSRDALEQVRLLTNLETDTQKLLQVILLGQPELRTVLARDDMRQLAQRITARYHLTPLGAYETGQYLRHRYRIAGGQHFPFNSGAVKRLHAHAGGVPRLINVIAERALLGGYALDRNVLDERIVDRAAREALAPSPRWPRHRIALATAAAVALVAVAAWWLRLQSPTTSLAVAATATPIRTTAPTVRVGDAVLAERLAALDPNGRRAWRELLTQWHLPAGDADIARAASCPDAITADLRCVRGRGGLDRLGVLGRPALLRLRAGDHDAWALLLGIDALDARLSLDGDPVDLDRLALERHWNGDYIALWRAPGWFETVAQPLSWNAHGPAVEWIHQRLQPRHVGPAVFDASMRDAVRRFQLARGLATDGVIGPETLMALSTNDAGPRLQRVLE